MYAQHLFWNRKKADLKSPVGVYKKVGRYSFFHVFKTFLLYHKVGMKC